MLTALGKDSVAFIAADEFPLGYEYDWMDLDGISSELPPDVAERTAVFLDCGNIERNPVEAFRGAARRSSTSTTTTTTRASGRSTTSSRTRRARPRSSGTCCRGLGVELTSVIAQALYVGLVTDTGRFSYENTTPRAHLMAADLVAAGVDVARDLPPRLRGLARVEASARRPRAHARRAATPAARSRWRS